MECIRENCDVSYCHIHRADVAAVTWLCLTTDELERNRERAISPLTMQKFVEDYDKHFEHIKRSLACVCKCSYCRASTDHLKDRSKSDDISFMKYKTRQRPCRDPRALKWFNMTYSECPCGRFAECGDIAHRKHRSRHSKQIATWAVFA